MTIPNLATNSNIFAFALDPAFSFSMIIFDPDNSEQIATSFFVRQPADMVIGGVAHPWYLAEDPLHWLFSIVAGFDFEFLG